MRTLIATETVVREDFIPCSYVFSIGHPSHPFSCSSPSSCLSGPGNSLLSTPMPKLYHLSHMVNIMRFSSFQHLPNDMRACPFIHLWKYCQNGLQHWLITILRSYSDPGSCRFLLLMYQGLLDADAMSAWLKVANLCQPNLEQMLNATFFLEEAKQRFHSFVESHLEANVKECYGNFVRLASPVVSQQDLNKLV
jgi:hypothetical protein